MPIRTNYKYPLDLRGDNPNNRAIAEAHSIGLVTHRIFIADHGPFFGNTIEVREVSTGRILEPTLDYKLVHSVREVQEITGQPIYQGVNIVNPDISTEIEIDLNYVGGEFSYSTRALLELLEGVNNDNRPVDWGGLLGVPSEFTPTPHLHSAYDLYAMKHLVASNMDVANAIREANNIPLEYIYELIDSRLKGFESVIPRLAESYRTAAARIESIFL